MGKSFDFDEQKRKVERGATNAEFLEQASDMFADYDTIVMVGMGKDGNVTTYRTTDSSVMAVGLLEVSKAQLLADMEE